MDRWAACYAVLSSQPELWCTVYTVAYASSRLKRQRELRQQLCVQRPPTPPIDTENVEFVIFIRAVKVLLLASIRIT